MDKIKYKKLGAGYYKVFIHRIHVADVSKINDGNEIHWELESTIQGKRRTSNPSTTSKILGGWKNWSSSRKSILHKYFERFIYKPNAFNDVIDAKFNGKGIVFGNDSIASLKGNGAKIGEKKSTLALDLLSKEGIVLETIEYSNFRAKYALMDYLNKITEFITEKTFKLRKQLNNIP